MVLTLARHTFEQGVGGRFYLQVRKYPHEGEKVDGSWTQRPKVGLINRCDEFQTYEATLEAGFIKRTS